MKPESIAVTVRAALMDRDFCNLAEAAADETTLYFRNKVTGKVVPPEIILEWIELTGRTPEYTHTDCDAANDLMTAAALLQLHGYKEQAKKTLKHAFYLQCLHATEDGRLELLEKTLQSAKQQAVAKKPRNKNYDEAMRIARNTWDKYPGASKGQLCKNLKKHFNNGVSVDRLDAWFTDAGIVPPKPQKYTSFSLVL
ncbi:hypothetical protein [Buttiauxella izardii]|uniref:Uncharacterized protein n=1 Tax=Buttiauxella izardii TaxID=82991 RepID=A0A3A5JZM5_9ENTR|nr:hypothetical protein [Buttiauxella izardii]RJT27693.1 hypothetical protein D6029_01890 [Buttiauxella izardii]